MSWDDPDDWELIPVIRMSTPDLQIKVEVNNQRTMREDKLRKLAACQLLSGLVTPDVIKLISD